MSERVSKLVYEASTFVVGLFCLSESVVFVLERDLVMLLEKHNKEDDAEKLMRGELKMLDLSKCRLGDNGAVSVATFIKVDDPVKVVWLYDCNIRARGAKAIADSLKRNKTVWDLDLRYNMIRDEAADFFIDALSHNICLNRISIVKTNISPESEATIEYLTETRNAILIPAAARRASLYLIAARRATPISDAGDVALFPKEIVKMIAVAVRPARSPNGLRRGSPLDVNSNRRAIDEI